ncbi:DNA repair protein RAD51 homolog 3 [Lingula anatina]|uniref:DNA repair protein RAD51 homolog 3 n=1 Tax=Lingula anatina TaxID=7574 RepID=A0A1S3HFT7_LINAN|nr:DNA repair protein RAD51 homolog 3 [Lingula anatina]|eukprot:XP_013384917.1 DNA repair protein RAD51 homolog 3 [Lingula anatina]
MENKERELSSFPLPPIYRSKLVAAGFITVGDIKDVRPVELSKELSISKEAALDILQTIENHSSTKPGSGHSSSCSQARTALDMLRDESLQQYIITFSERLDDMLGGGVPLTKTTEFCGAPGIGKTQMSFQLSVDVQIPECFGGLGGEAVYIDTEGSFIVDRLIDVAKATVEHCQHIAAAENSAEQVGALKTFSVESILKGIHYYRCHNYVELIATVHLLPEFLKEHSQVKLIIVDSIAFHFRHDFDDLALRTRLLNGMSQSFIRLANEHTLAVVLTNQMTTRFSVDQQGQSYLIPALGESWGHASTVRVVLYWENSQRWAKLYKSPYRKEDTIPYQVTTGGIRDVQITDPVTLPTHTHLQDESQPCGKKRKIDTQ